MTNKNFKRRGKKPSTKRTERKEPDSNVAEKRYNDPSWYIKEGQLAKDVASLSFNNALGAKFRIENELDYGRGTATTLVSTVPGITTINVAPAIGFSGDGSSPINIAAKNIYSYVRHMNSGHSNYDAPDLMLYLGAMDSVYSFIATLMRAYGTARVFSQVNRYVGDALLTAQGFNPLEVRSQLSNLRSYINMFITKASAFCTPNVMTLYRRHFWMFSGVYKDEDIQKSQMYMYRPVSLWKYEELDGAGKLSAVPFLASFTEANGITPTAFALQSVYTYGNNMLSALTNSEDINIMSGDILKAYGQGNLWQLGLINEDYVVLPVYSEEVLDQIHNTTFVGSKPTTGVNQTTTADPVASMTGLDVTQNTDPNQDGRIVFTPEFIGVSHPSWTRILDLHYDEPTPEQILVATRNTVMGAVMSQTNTYTLEVLTCGSDLALTFSIYSINPNTGNVTYLHMGVDDNTGSTIGYLNLMNKFKRFPVVYRMSGASGNAPGNVTDICGDLDNYTILSFEDLNKMHESAILAQLGVPFYGVAQG